MACTPSDVHVCCGAVAWRVDLPGAARIAGRIVPRSYRLNTLVVYRLNTLKSAKQLGEMRFRNLRGRRGTRAPMRAGLLLLLLRSTAGDVERHCEVVAGVVLCDEERALVARAEVRSCSG